MSAVAVGAAVAGAAVSYGLNSMSGSSSGSAATAADPFASQRGQYQTQLSNLLTNPSSITSTPGYQYTLQQGENAVNAGAASSGMLNSGNRLQALQNVGQQSAEQEYASQVNVLAQLSGATSGSPATAGQIIAGQNSSNMAAAGTIGNAVTSGLNNYYGNSGNSGNSGYSGSPISGYSDYGLGSSGNTASDVGSFSYGSDDSSSLSF